jgi:predicted transcriptional regulator
MEMQNITLSLPKDVLRKIKLIAVQRETSVSGLVTQALEAIVQREEAYAYAQRRHLDCLASGFDLGTGGQPLPAREALHER